MDGAVERHPPGGRVAALDGLRALAVAGVFAVHVLGGTFRGGGVGVDVFFVLSGFLITSLLLEEHRAGGAIALGWFYMRRWLRLAPALLALAALTTAAVLLDARVRAGITGAGGYGAALVAALSYTTDVYLPVTHAVNPLSHTWSLAVEEQFYLVWPVVLVAVLRRPRPGLRRAFAGAVAVALLVQVVLAVAAGPGWTTFTPLGHASELMAGALLAAWAPHPVGTPWAVLGLAALAVYAVAGSSGAVTSAVALPLMTVATLAVVAHVTTTRSVVTSLLGAPALVWVGRRSYGVYLYHFPILWVVGNAGLRRSVAVPVEAALSLAVAAASYRWVEQPFLRRKVAYEPRRAPGLLAD